MIKTYKWRFTFEGDRAEVTHFIFVSALEWRESELFS